MNQFFGGLIVIFCLLLGCGHSQAKKTGSDRVASSSEDKKKPEKTKASQASQPQKKDQAVMQLIAKYKEQTPVEVKIRKRVLSPYLMKEKVSEGVLKIGKGIFRLDLEKPDHSIMVLDGKNIWLESRMGAEIQVSKFLLNETRRANAIFAVLFDSNGLVKGFRLSKVNKKPDGSKEFIYKPQKKAIDYTEISIQILPKEEKLLSFSYQDELENVVVYDFGKTNFKSKIGRWQLEYTPPKGVKPNVFE